MGLAPLVFELHTDQRGGSSGLIAAPGDNPTFTALRGAYGAPFDPANYKAPGMGVNLLELSATPDNPTSETINTAALKLYNTLMSVDAVKNGSRPLHFFAGHGDVTTGQTGAPGEKAYVKAVKLRLKELAKGNKNFYFYDSILDPNDTSRESGDESTTNWGRGSRIVSSYRPRETPAPPPASQSVGPAPSPTPEPSPEPDTDDGPTVTTPPRTSDRPSAVERTTKFKTVNRDASDVVTGFGNKYDEMESSRLADALKGTQIDIIKKRIENGEFFGTKQVPVPAE